MECWSSPWDQALCVVLDIKLSWIEHMNKKVVKMGNCISVMKRYEDFCTLKLIRQLRGHHLLVWFGGILAQIKKQQKNKYCNNV